MKILPLKILFVFSLVLILMFCFVDLAEAQCAMCRASAESNLKNGGTEGQGLNRGILYLFAMPYLMVGTLGYLWWRNKKREEKEEDAGFNSAQLN